MNEAIDVPVTSSGLRVGGNSDQSFRVGLYLEHLEEASFLYDQLTHAEPDPELSWVDRAEDEERLEAHLDALVVGADLALAVCAQQAAEGDFGELYAAVCTFCRQADGDRLDAVLDALDPDDDERVQAVADALCDEASPAWQDRVAALLGAGEPVLPAVAARVVGYRRWEAPAGALTALLDSPDDALVEAAAWALGRLQVQSARAPLYRLLQHHAPAVCTAAATALLRLGEPNTIQVCAHRAAHTAGPDSGPDSGTASWALLPLALAGGPSHGQVLRDVAAADDAPPDALLALGLLGDPAAVDLLLYQLGTDGLADAAAEALHLLTGAGLTETVFVPEDVDEDELFDDELEAYRRGERPTRADGTPYGSDVTRLAQDVGAWREWWDEHRAQFAAGTRYRFGAPCSPARLATALAAPSTPASLRALLTDELAVRYGVDAGLETRMRVSNQQAILRRLATRDGSTSLRPGHWFFAGRPLR